MALPINGEQERPTRPVNTLQPVAAAQPTAPKKALGVLGNALPPKLGQAGAALGAQTLLTNRPNAPKPTNPLTGMVTNRLGITPTPTETAAPLPGGIQPIQPLTPVPVGTETASPAPDGAGPITKTAPSGAFPQTDPNNPLTTQTIQRTPEQDRFAIAQQRFNTFVESTDPQYKAALRDANRYGAATGRLGSGELRTSFGDLAGQRDLQLRTQGNTFLQNALEGTIDDQFRDVGVAQQQQGFQNQQQQQAFENELRRRGFSEDMINSAFGRALQQYNAGALGGTGSATGIQVGQNQFNQGSDALNALNALIRGKPATGTPMSTPPINPQPTYPWQAPAIPVGAG